MGYNIQAVCCTEIAAAVMAFMLLISSKKAIIDNQFGDKVFNALIAVTIFSPINELLSFLLIGVPGTWVAVASWIMDCLCFVGTGSFAMLWAVYTDIRLHNNGPKCVSKKYWFAIPYIVEMIIIASTPITGWVFRIVGENNDYVRGPLTVVTYIIPALYIIFSLGEVFYVSRKKPSFGFWPFVMVALASFAAMAIQVLVYGIAVIWLMAGIALCMIFIQLQNELRFRDPMTGMYNRGEFELMLKDVVEGKYSLVGIMIDIDQFKRINDRWGHAIGNYAIAELSEILTAESQGKWVAIHYNGDEFILLSSKSTMDEAKEVLKRINDEIERRYADVTESYELSVSMGIGTIEAGENNVESFLKEMYGNVAKVKEAKYERYE